MPLSNSGEVIHEESLDIRNSPLFGLQVPTIAVDYLIVRYDEESSQLYTVEQLRRNASYYQLLPSERSYRRLHCVIDDPIEVFGLNTDIPYEDLVRFHMSRRYLSKDYIYKDETRQVAHFGSTDYDDKQEAVNWDLFEGFSTVSGNLGVNTYLAYKLISETKSNNRLRNPQSLIDYAEELGVAFYPQELKLGFQKLVSAPIIKHLLDNNIIEQEDLNKYFARAGYWLFALTNEIVQGQKKQGVEIALDLPFPIKLDEKEYYPDYRMLPFIFTAFAAYFDPANLIPNRQKGKTIVNQTIKDSLVGLYALADLVLSTQLNKNPDKIGGVQKVLNRFTQGFQEMMFYYDQNPGLLNQSEGGPSLVTMPSVANYRNKLNTFLASAGSRRRSPK